MRPKKTILLYCPDDAKISVLRFVIGNHLRFRVVSANTVDELEMARTELSIDAVVLMGVSPAVAGLIFGLFDYIDTKRLYIHDNAMADTGHPIDAYYAVMPSAAVLIERLLILVARKRGPRKIESKRDWYKAERTKLHA